MTTPVAEIGACQGCGACLLTCPSHAIRPRGGVLRVVASLCDACGECVEICPVDAIDLVPRPVSQDPAGQCPAAAQPFGAGGFRAGSSRACAGPESRQP